MANAKARQKTFNVSECARRTGLTVKALRVYEGLGLLKPKRTMKDWRVYDEGDLLRIGEISALRALGFKLADIATVLRGHEPGLGRMLELQQQELLRRRIALDRSLAGIAILRRRVALGETLTINELAKVIKETQMTATNPDTLAWKRYEQMRPRVAIASDPANMAQCCGHFAFSGGLLMNVFMSDGVLKAQVLGQPALRIFPEALDNYFFTEVPAQITFDRSHGGAVTSLTLHQGGLNQVAKRVADSEAERLSARFGGRVESGRPHARSQELVEKLLDGQASGRPPLELMTPELAAVVSEQSAAVTASLRELGDRTGLRFMAVTPQGWDCFRATFENGELDVSIFVDDAGRVAGAEADAPKADSFWSQMLQLMQ